MPRPKTEFDVTIEEVTFGGQGFARIEEKAVFVPDVLPGELVRIRILKDKSDYATAATLKILEPSKKRIEISPEFVMPVQSLTGRPLAWSPGYCYYYTSYKNEVALKQEQFSKFLGKLPTFKKKQLLKPLASPDETHYRNKITLRYQNDHGDRKLGYIMADNATVLDLPACALAHPAINEELATLKAKPGFLHSFPNEMPFTLRYTEVDGVVSWRNEPRKDMRWLREATPIGEFSVPAGSFFQVNSKVAAFLVEQVQAWLAKLNPSVVYDLYCGAGLFGIAAAMQGVERVVGIDVDAGGIEAARYNAKQRDLTQCEFSRGRADDLFEMHAASTPSGSCLILDPPRTGLHPRLIHQIGASGIPHIIYISCSPDTLVRDLQRLERKGYTACEFRLADMFPRTSHFETMTLLTKMP